MQRQPYGPLKKDWIFKPDERTETVVSVFFRINPAMGEKPIRPSTKNALSKPLKVLIREK